MLSSDEWCKEVVREGAVMCRACGAPHPTMGACAVGAMTVHQEYICEACGHEFTARLSAKLVISLRRVQHTCPRPPHCRTSVPRDSRVDAS